ncbi:MAG: acetolactate synthase [Bacteroidales bacterium]
MKTTLQQLSIFLENKIGSLIEIMQILSKADIRIIAATVADTTEFGILRLITTDNAKAGELLKEANKNSSKSEVIAIACDSSASSFYENVNILTSGGVVVEYMYCFSVKGQAFLILNVNDDAKALELLTAAGVKTISNNDLINL